MAAKEAREFSTLKTYAAGDLVLYGGKLYRFTASHSAGAWTGSDVAEMDAEEQQDLTRILAGVDNAERASDYADTVIFEPEQISGTRYRYILTNAADPRE